MVSLNETSEARLKPRRTGDRRVGEPVIVDGKPESLPCHACVAGVHHKVLVFARFYVRTACTEDARYTEQNARTPGRAARVREDGKRSRYPPEKNPHAELTPFVVEARGRLGSEVLSFLRQHAPEEEPLRSAVLARATREISIITQRGLAALLLSAEPRPAMV